MTAPVQSPARTVVERTPVEGRCAACGAEDLRGYPVLSEGGWWAVVRCQTCLSCASRERWAPLGYVSRMAF
jgi:vanillate/4-hydroxybenzoate decarboxylase subunit D